jgi:hypothetical protein
MPEGRKQTNQTAYHHGMIIGYGYIYISHA